MPDESKEYPVRATRGTGNLAGRVQLGHRCRVAAGLFYAGSAPTPAGQLRIPAAFCGSPADAPFGRCPVGLCTVVTASTTSCPMARERRGLRGRAGAIAGADASDRTVWTPRSRTRLARGPVRPADRRVRDQHFPAGSDRRWRMRSTTPSPSWPTPAPASPPLCCPTGPRWSPRTCSRWPARRWRTTAPTPSTGGRTTTRRPARCWPGARCVRADYVQAQRMRRVTQDACTGS